MHWKDLWFSWERFCLDRRSTVYGTFLSLLLKFWVKTVLFPRRFELDAQCWFRGFWSLTHKVQSNPDGSRDLKFSGDGTVTIQHINCRFAEICWSFKRLLIEFCCLWPTRTGFEVVKVMFFITPNVWDYMSLNLNSNTNVFSQYAWFFFPPRNILQILIFVLFLFFSIAALWCLLS